MLSSFFRKLSRQKSRSNDAAENAVDLSRVIPDYVSPFEAGDSTSATPDVVEDQSHADLDQASVETTAADRSDIDAIAFEDLDMEGKAEAAVEALASKHDAWANNDLANLTNAWAEIKGHETLEGQLDDLARISHNLKGMAATYGYPAIGRIASSLCNLLESGRASNQHALINLHVEACRAAHLQSDDVGANEKIAQSVCVALETQVSRTISV